MRRAFSHVPPSKEGFGEIFIVILSLIAFAPWSWFFWLIMGPIMLLSDLDKKKK